MTQDCRNQDQDASTAEGELRRRFGERWQIVQPALGVWSVTHRSEDGRHIRCIVARTAAELAGKLETAETVAP